jgi:hypothetical protein
MKLKCTIVTSIVLLFFSFKTHSQKHLVKLSGKDLKIFDTNYYVHNVIIAQEEKLLLGFDHKGEFLRFDNSIEKTLTTYFSKKLPFNENKKPLTLKVNKIALSCWLGMCFTELSVGFYIYTEDGAVEIMQTGTITGLEFDILTPRRRGKTILNAFKNCFNELHIREKNVLLREKKVPLDSLAIKPSITKNDLPILNNQNRIKGVFYGFGQFIDDLPDTTIQFRVEKAYDTNRVVVKFNRRFDKSNIWGICDGEDYYHKFGHNFHKLRMDSVINIYFDSRDLNNNAETAMMFFGPIGYVLVSLIESFNAKPIRKELDLLTGRILPKSREADLIIECTNKQNEDSICIYHNDIKKACLNGGEFYRFKYSPEMGIDKIVFKSGRFKKTLYINPIDDVQMIRVSSRQNWITIKARDRLSDNKLIKHLNNKKEIISE